MKTIKFFLTNLAFAAAISLLAVGIFTGFTIYNIFIESGLSQSIGPLIKAAYILNEYYVEPLDQSKTKERLIAGLVNDLDPHTLYLPQKDFEKFQEDLKGEYGGIGIGAKPSNDNQALIIKDIMEKGPASDAGLSIGQYITHIDGIPIGKSSLQENFKKIRGKIGSAVILSVAPTATDQPKKISVTRSAITPPTAQWSIIQKQEEQPILYLRVSQFNEDMAPQTVNAIRSAAKITGGKFSGIILDLRDNPGGLVNSAVALAAIFGKPNAVVVSSKEKNGEHVWTANEEHWATQEDLPGTGIKNLISENEWLSNTPLMVLVNRHSASAAEIVAAALQDWKRATILGNNTFGKGSIQSIIPLGGGNGSIKVTTSRYYTPNNHPIQAVGVNVDVFVKSVFDRGYREADLPKHLASENIKEATGVDKNEEGVSSNKKNDEMLKSPEYIAAAERQTFATKINISNDDPYVLAAVEQIKALLKGKL